MHAQPSSGLTDTVETIADKVASGELKMSSDEDEEASLDADAVPAAVAGHVDVPTATVAPSGGADTASVTSGMQKLSTDEE